MPVPRWASGVPAADPWLPPAVSVWASSPTLLTNPGGAWPRTGTRQLPWAVPGTHSAVRVDLGALHGDGDAVEEDDDEDHMVEHLVRDDPVTQEAEPAPGQRPRPSGRQGRAAVRGIAQGPCPFLGTPSPRLLSHTLPRLGTLLALLGWHRGIISHEEERWGAGQRPPAYRD